MQGIWQELHGVYGAFYTISCFKQACKICEQLFSFAHFWLKEAQYEFCCYAICSTDVYNHWCVVMNHGNGVCWCAALMMKQLCRMLPLCKLVQSRAAIDIYLSYELVYSTLKLVYTNGRGDSCGYAVLRVLLWSGCITFACFCLLWFCFQLA